MSFHVHHIAIHCDTPGRRILHWVGSVTTPNGTIHRNGAGYFLFEDPKLPVYPVERFVHAFDATGTPTGQFVRFVGWTHDPDDQARLCICGLTRSAHITDTPDMRRVIEVAIGHVPEWCNRFVVAPAGTVADHHPAASALLGLRPDPGPTHCAVTYDGQRAGHVRVDHAAACQAALDSVSGAVAADVAHLFAAARLDAHRVHHHHSTSRQPT